MPKCLAPISVLVALVLAAGFSRPVLAQMETATLSGRVTDPQGAVVPDAEVVVTNIDVNVSVSTMTNQLGIYVTPNLRPGRYRLSIRKEGFKQIVQTQIVLHVQDTIALNFALEVGSVAQSVTVTGGAPLVNTESGAVGTVVDRQFVGNLPLNGRTFQSLIALTPGVVLTNLTGNEEGHFSVNGQRTNANYFTIDGVSANIGSSVSFSQALAGQRPGLSAFGSSNSLVSIDAMQEFKVQTSTFAPEYGRTPGAQVSIITRSGTNQFHGTLFEYFRNDALDANDWFANRAGLKKPPLRQNDFGGTFGGPVLLPSYNGRNRTFFFVSYEGLRLRLPQTRLDQVPSVDSRSAAVPSIRPFLDLFPVPNGADLGNNLAEFGATYADPSRLDATSIRLDHALSKKLALFGRYNYAPSETSRRLSGALSNVQATQGKTHTLTIGATYMMARTMSNDFRANYSKDRTKLGQSLDDFGGAVPPPESILLPAGHSLQDSTQVVLFGGPLLYVVGTQRNNLQRQVNLVDTFSLTTRSHLVKFGVDYRRLMPVITPRDYGQAVIFGSVAQAITGVATLVSISADAGSRFPVYTNLSFFWQDTWRIAPRFTLTYGLRWELNPPPREKNGNDPDTVINVDDPATLALAPFPTPLYKTSHDNFAPRFGAAYQLSQRPNLETVLRGGFGLFYDVGSGQSSAGFAGGFRYSANKRLFSVPFPLDPTSAAPPPIDPNPTPPFGAINGAFDPDFEVAYTYQWNFTVDQALGSSQAVSVSYVAAIGRRLARLERLFQPNPNFASFVALTRSVGTSDYHALQLQFQRRLSRGLQALASYAWSHSLDDASSDSLPEAPLDQIDLTQQRGSSDYDVRHAFSLALTYDIPAPYKNRFASALLRSWSTDSIFRTRSAFPVNVITGFLLGAGGGASQPRPDLVPGVELYVEDPTEPGGKRINPAAFAMPAGSQGTLGRNALRGFPMWQLDFALRRQFALTETVKLLFRTEAFNIFNHPNFADPGANLNATNTITNPQFGRSQSMLANSLSGGPFATSGLSSLYHVGGARSLQLSLKLMF